MAEILGRYPGTEAPQLRRRTATGPGIAVDFSANTRYCGVGRTRGVSGFTEFWPLHNPAAGVLLQVRVKPGDRAVYHVPLMRWLGEHVPFVLVYDELRFYTQRLERMPEFI